MIRSTSVLMAAVLTSVNSVISKKIARIIQMNTSVVSNKVDVFDNV